MAALAQEAARSTPELKAAFERGFVEILSAASNEEEEVGPFRRYFIKYRRPGHTGHEPLHRYKESGSIDRKSVV